MNRKWPLAVLALFMSLAAALASVPEFEQQMAVQESLSRVHPRMRARWLRERRLDDSYYTTFRKPESSGLREVGRWPWGPSWELAGRDTFLYLGSGSGVRILSIADSVQPRMLGQIVCRGLVSQVVVQDSLLFVACGSWGAQVYSVTDPANPRELGSMDAVIGDLCVKDTFCYTVGGDSLRIYNLADAQHPAVIGCIVREGGDVVLVANGHAFVGGPGPLDIYDVTDPSNPTWVNSLGGPTYDMFVRRNLLFRTTGASTTRFSILNIADPLNITEVSGLNNYAGTEGIYANDSFAFVSCIRAHVGLFVFDVSDSSRPVVCDSIAPEGNVQWEPYAPQPRSYCYLADDYGGLDVIDAHDANNLSEAWSGYKAASSVDICIDNNRAYIANSQSGLQVVDVTDPTAATSLGIFDIFGAKVTSTAAARDSFAYIGMSGIARREYLRVLDVLDPSNPAVVAQESCFNPPLDYVLRDSFIYAVEYAQFQVFNVARPREPVRVGSCNTQEQAYGLCVVDSLAYVANYPFAIINVKHPSNPSVVGTISRGAWNGSVRDTFLFLSSGGILVFSVADPSQPRLLDSLSVGPNTYWVEAVGSLLYTGNRDGVRVVDASDVHNMKVRGFCPSPYTVNRLTYKSPYIYAACWEAGVCIFESTQVAVEEPKPKTGQRPKTAPTIARGAAWMNPPEPGIVMDAAGRRVAEIGPGRARTVLKAGVYFVRDEGRGAGDAGRMIRKVVVLK